MLILVLFSGFIYYNLVFDIQQNVVYSLKKTLKVNKKEIVFRCKLPYKETLFLKIKIPKEYPIDKVIVNGQPLQPQKARLRGIIYTYYFFLPKNYLF